MGGLMFDFVNFLGFVVIVFGMVLMLGLNMIYLILWLICQGLGVGLILLGGVVLGFVVYLFCVVLGIMVIVMVVFYVYDVLCIVGVGYFLWLVWQVVCFNGWVVFQLCILFYDLVCKLFLMGLLISLLNFKIVVLYLLLLL